LFKQLTATSIIFLGTGLCPVSAAGFLNTQAKTEFTSANPMIHVIQAIPISCKTLYYWYLRML